MIHLYALCDGPDDLADLPGIDDARVRTVEIDRGLSAVHSEHPRRPVPTRERALRHFEVVAAVCGRQRAVPVRYGAVHSDPAALREAMLADVSDLRSRLERVAGHVEILLRHTERPREPSPPAAPGRRADPAAAGAGRAYLQAKRDAEAHQVAAQTEAHERLRRRSRHLDASAADVVERDGPAGPERCFLVPQGQAEQLLAALRAAATTGDDAEALVVGGPWPPYTFA